MTKLEIIKMRFELRQEALEDRKRDVASLKESMEHALGWGHYNEVAQWAERITEQSYQIEAVEKELREFSAYLKDLEEPV